MKWRTEIGKIGLPLHIDHSSTCLLLGSCFAEHIGEKLVRSKFLCTINPTGITYNPVSLLNHLTLASTQHDILEEELKLRDSSYVHLHFHSQFTENDKSACARGINGALKSLRGQLKDASIMFISLGSCIVFKEKETETIVANCHKLSPSLFEKYMLSQNETEESINNIVEIIQTINPHTDIVFTISPVRHSRHGLIEDNRSKAQLISAVHNTIGAFTKCHYFPSYEIMKDDLRDYRFYKEDMVHPSQQAIDYMWNSLLSSCMSSETQSKIREIEKLMMQVNHRFLTQDNMTKINALEKLQFTLSQHEFKDRFLNEREEISRKIACLT